jgi:hypothetical protein
MDEIVVYHAVAGPVGDTGATAAGRMPPGGSDNPGEQLPAGRQIYKKTANQATAGTESVASARARPQE